MENFGRQMAWTLIWCAVIGAIAYLVSGCATMPVVEVCGEQCATGYYSDDGSVITAAHAFRDGESVSVSSQIGYSDKGIVELGLNDSASVTVANPYHARTCSSSARKGDLVRVNTLHGPVVTRILSVHPNGYTVKAHVSPGDSGSPVTRRGCVIGRIHGVSNGVVEILE